MEISPQAKERFCKDCNIPLKLFQEPYFTHRLKLYDRFYNTLEKWKLFTGELSKYHCEQDYFQEYNRVKDTAIRDIQGTEGYERFNQEDMNRYRILHAGLPGKDIFKPSNDGKSFLSFDMKKANFSSLRHYDPGIFRRADTWEDFIGHYTDNRHMIASKYIRQVILGNCNPKRHITYEKYLMDMVLTLLEQKEVPMEKVVFFSNDEIVLELSPSRQEPFALSPDLLTEGAPAPIRTELFTLHRIHGTEGYYKEIATQKGTPEIEFKCLDSYVLPFVLRKFLGEDVTESDRIFYYEGLLASFMEVPKISF